MSIEEQNKRAIHAMVQAVWTNHDLSALPIYWADDCVNHAAPEHGQVGLDALRTYHEGFLTGFLPALSNPRIEFSQQIAEGDRVVSQMLLRANHSGPLLGNPPTGKAVVLASIRIDCFEGARLPSTGRSWTWRGSCGNFVEWTKSSAD